jgi:hypothetical protein
MVTKASRWTVLMGSREGMAALDRGDAVEVQAQGEQTLARYPKIAAQPSITRALAWLGAARFGASALQSAQDVQGRACAWSEGGRAGSGLLRGSKSR